MTWGLGSNLVTLAPCLGDAVGMVGVIKKVKKQKSQEALKTESGLDLYSLQSRKYIFKLQNKKGKR